MGSYFMLDAILVLISVHCVFYMNTILIISCSNEDEDEGEIHLYCRHTTT